MSQGGVAYTVNIYEDGYTGSIVDLKGAPAPFVTQEDNDDDIFRAVRKQTGYLRVVLDESESGYLEQLQPAYNTEKLVRLLHTENNTTVIDWQGFMQTRVFSQPWENNAHMVEFPLNSMLASLEHKRVSGSLANTGTVSTLGAIVNAMESLGADLMSGIDIIDDSDGAWSRVLIDQNAFFDTNTEQEDGYSMQTQYGKSQLAVVEMVCEVFGLQLRENGSRLVVAMYDNGDNLTLRSTDWATAKSIASGQGNLPAGSTMPSPSDVLTEAVWRGSDNQANYLPGAHKVEIEFTPGNGGDSAVLTMPNQNPDDDVSASEITLRWPDSDYSKVWVQNFANRVNTVESFAYREWDGTAYQVSDRQHCIDVSVLGNVNDRNTYSGAWPVVFGDRRQAYASVQMKSGVFLQQTEAEVDPSPGYLMKDCYRMISSEDISLKAGSFLNINFNQHGFTYDRGAGGAPTDISYEGDGRPATITVLALSIRVGNYVYNGTTGMHDILVQLLNNNLTNYCAGSWVNGVQDVYQVCVGFNETEMITNKIDTDLISFDAGVLIPIPNDISGQLRVGIRNMVMYENIGPAAGVNANSRIIDNFTVKILQCAPAFYSVGQTNRYVKTLANGFKSEAKKSLKLGTINCNAPSPSLLLNPNRKYLKSIPFAGESVAQRPEKHLLGRMSDYYNETRHAYAGQVLKGLDLFTTRWQIDDSIYMAVDATHEWARDRQTVRLIETETENT